VWGLVRRLGGTAGSVVIRCRRRWRRRRCSARVGAGHGGGGGLSGPGSGWLRCGGESMRSARFAGGRGRWGWSGRGLRCTARTVAGCGPVVSGGRRGTALRKRHSRTPPEYLENPDPRTRLTFPHNQTNEQTSQQSHDQPLLLEPVRPLQGANDRLTGVEIDRAGWGAGFCVVTQDQLALPFLLDMSLGWLEQLSPGLSG
jgi:hypothetical protein